MNIIIVAESHATPKTINLKSWRVRLALGAILFAGAICCAGVGALGFEVYAQPDKRVLNEVRALQKQIVEQKHEVGALETTSHRDLDALALKLGELQAQSMRLNALGERLTRAGKLDDGEFDFTEAPAMGGPEDTAATSHLIDNQLLSSIDRLRNQFANQETQLTVLENMLLDRHVDNALMPSGMPVESGYIGSGFGSRTDPITGQIEQHAGLDFDAPPGSDVLAVAEGVVTWSGDKAGSGYGNVVEIDHGNGYMTRYAHNSKNLVQVGERIHAGQIIAKVGSTGRATGPHCHFEVWLNGHVVNPLSYVQDKKRG